MLYELIIHDLRQRQIQVSCPEITIMSHESHPVITRLQAAKQGLEPLPEADSSIFHGGHKGKSKQQ